MKISVSYNGRLYGNSAPASRYRLAITRSRWAPTVTVAIKYHQPAAGFGIGWSQGAVTAGSLELTPEAAVALGQALLLGAQGALSEPIALEIDEVAAAKKQEAAA